MKKAGDILEFYILPFWPFYFVAYGIGQAHGLAWGLLFLSLVYLLFCWVALQDK